MDTSIFLSHNKEDKEFVRRLAQDLRRAGITAWLDEAEIKPADSIIDKIEEGLKDSKYLAVILSPASVNSSWVKRELRTILHQQITLNNKIVIPLLYKHCEIPQFLIDILYIDFTDTNNYSFAMRQLLHLLDPSFSSPQFVSGRELQELLDKIPNPVNNKSILQSKTDQDDIDFVSSHSIDLSELEAKTPWERPKIYTALRELIKQHKVEIFLFKGILDGGQKFMLPLVYKGLLPPQLRSPDDEVENLFMHLERQ